MQPARRFVLESEVRALLNHYSSLLGIRIGFNTPEGRALYIAQRKPICQYCRMLRSELGWEHKCQALDRAQEKAAAARRGLLSYVCHGGLHEAILPVYSQGRLLGLIVTGQFRSVKKLPPSVQLEWTRRFKEDRLRQAFHDVPYVAPAKVQNLLGLLEIIVRFIDSQHLIHLQDAMAPVLERMHERPEEPLTLKQAAEMLHRSPSTLSHSFQKLVGKGFKRAQIEARMEKADALFRKDPSTTVREVAFKLGYEDPLYFSRLYRKYRGHPPSEHRRRNRTTAFTGRS